eukprot:TRINITY_DN62805_c0_g1_i1.p1 TRINITY_DN62805_c0_g1~~TRINITY_DN62805_c0_g1_i1.p1  ORF type:complete len:182 (+),score=11.51 TRINITY_DN62805_c0_g1_i1:129-674(+)
MTDTPVTMIDFGSSSIKYGTMVKEQDPPDPHVFPTTFGEYKECERPVYEILYGQQALDDSRYLKLHWPIQDGVVTHWDDWEKLLWHLWNKKNSLLPPSEEAPLLVSEPPHQPKAKRDKLVCELFETFEVPMLGLASTPQLSLFGSGKQNGVVMDIGHTMSHSSAVVQGKSCEYQSSTACGV